MVMHQNCANCGHSAHLHYRINDYQWACTVVNPGSRICTCREFLPAEPGDDSPKARGQDEQRENRIRELAYKRVSLRQEAKNGQRIAELAEKLYIAIIGQWYGSGSGADPEMIKRQAREYAEIWYDPSV
jgi:hypothetical protein